MYQYKYKEISATNSAEYTKMLEKEAFAGWEVWSWKRTDGVVSSVWFRRKKNCVAWVVEQTLVRIGFLLPSTHQK